ncbi:hypothetical protein ACFFX0_03000 [Citricoccus parietis]|uniref:Uncharacterized protein n=1 Tax=Citricoccus parietis TaxID=592307 RepID=A0ABV5FU50_9MICC
MSMRDWFLSLEVVLVDELFGRRFPGAGGRGGFARQHDDHGNGQDDAEQGGERG